MYIMCSWTSSLVSLLFCLLPPLAQLGPAVVLFTLPGGEVSLPGKVCLFSLSRTRRGGGSGFCPGEARAGRERGPARAGPRMSLPLP